MEQVARCTDALITAIRQSEDFRRYVKAERAIHEDPELKRRIDEYRIRAYELQGALEGIFEGSEALLQEFGSLLRLPLAAEYLDAESSVCRMLRLTVEQLSTGVAVELPQSGK